MDSPLMLASDGNAEGAAGSGRQGRCGDKVCAIESSLMLT